ncbi:hypothetical protein [Alkalimarinus coralli]|uniref:hypothetical protein n=1 Tax=Alkalimarinus coralli TaxID=2935863 RepID=UPI00202B32B4|nr:hypothetical protein [Alkalimarinus coralli]
MQNRLTTALTAFRKLCRNKEIRGLFLIGYLLLLMWPFFATETPSLWSLYLYYHSVWGILVIGLAVQGYLVLTSERSAEEADDD